MALSGNPAMLNYCQKWQAYHSSVDCAQIINSFFRPTMPCKLFQKGNRQLPLLGLWSRHVPGMWVQRKEDNYAICNSYFWQFSFEQQLTYNFSREQGRERSSVKHRNFAILKKKKMNLQYSSFEIFCNRINYAAV